MPQPVSPPVSPRRGQNLSSVSATMSSSSVAGESRFISPRRHEQPKHSGGGDDTIEAIRQRLMSTPLTTATPKPNRGSSSSHYPRHTSPEKRNHNVASGHHASSSSASSSLILLEGRSEEMAAHHATHQSELMDSYQRDAVRLASLLSAARDEGESLNCRIVRLEAQVKSQSNELDVTQEQNRHVRRELEESRRAHAELATVTAELKSSNEALQSLLYEQTAAAKALQTERDTREEQRKAEAARCDAMSNQLDMQSQQIGLLRQAVQTLERELSKAQQDAATAHARFDEFRSGVAKESRAVSGALERAIQLHGLPGAPQNAISESEELLVSLMAQDPSVDSRANTVTKSGGSDLGEVKQAVSPLYQTAKALRTFLVAARTHRRELEEMAAESRAQAVSSERDLRASLEEATILAGRATHAEMHTSRLLSQLESAKRASDEATTRETELLRSLSEILQTIPDATAIETQCRIAVGDRNTLLERSRTQGDTIHRLREELVQVQQACEDRITQVEDTAKLNLAIESAATKQRIAALVEERKKVVFEAAAEKEQSSSVAAALQAELETLGTKYEEALQRLSELEPAHRQLQREATALRSRTSVAEKELEASRRENDAATKQYSTVIGKLKEKVAAYHGADNSDTSADAEAESGTVAVPSSMQKCTLFETLLLVLRVLEGARKDIDEMAWQRRALTRYILEFEKLFGPLSAHLSTTAPLRSLMRLRRAVVAVLFANRLRSFTKSRQQYREAMVGTRRGVARVRLLPENKVYMKDGLLTPAPSANGRTSTNNDAIQFVAPSDFVLPTVMEAKDVPTCMAILCGQVKVPPPRNGGGWNQVSPPLASHLRDSLHRALLRLSRSGPTNAVSANVSLPFYYQAQQDTTRPPSPPRRQSMVSFPSASLLAAPPSLAAAPNQSLLDASGYRSHRGSIAVPNDAPFSSTFPPPSQQQPQQQQAAPQTTTVTYATPAHYSATYPPPLVAAPPPQFQQQQQQALSSSQYSHRPSQVWYGPPPVVGPPPPSEEFTSELLNVIRALDTKVAGALRKNRH